MSHKNLFPPEPAVDETIACGDLEHEIAVRTETSGFRLFSIFPADAPREAILERDGRFVRLATERLPSPQSMLELEKGLMISRNSDSQWQTGRAGMQYRDLIPGRLGGSLIASHIRIPDGGPVPDYVHFHKVDFQVICCIKGWCRLVYEDQGEPFVFEAGDCVLQPPGIRHQVLECSDGFEVVELSSPAEHPTYAEHRFGLPTTRIDLNRNYDGQRFAHSQFRQLQEETPTRGVSLCRTGLREASAGAIGAEWVKMSDALDRPFDLSFAGTVFLFIVSGSARITDRVKSGTLSAGDAAVVDTGELEISSANPGTRLLVLSTS